MPGYSGTPLAKKLGIKPGSTIASIGAPDQYPEWLAPLPEGSVHCAIELSEACADHALLHWFGTGRERLAEALDCLGKAIFPDRALWISWPKRASRVPTTITEDVIRELCLPLGLVDIKVCAVSEVWSGLKLVWRREERGKGSGRAKTGPRAQ